MRGSPTLTLDSVEALAAGKRATRTTHLRVSNDGTSRAKPTARRGMVNQNHAKRIGAISAPSGRMGDAARKRAIRKAPKRWATRRIMSATELAAWKENT